MRWLICRQCGLTVEAGDLICAGCTANLTEPGAVAVAATSDHVIPQSAESNKARSDDPIPNGETS